MVLGSDGLQYLTDDEIRATLQDNADAPSQDIADSLLQALIAKADPDQDNISIAVVKATGQ